MDRSRGWPSNNLAPAVALLAAAAGLAISGFSHSDVLCDSCPRPTPRVPVLAHDASCSVNAET